MKEKKLLFLMCLLTFIIYCPTNLIAGTPVTCKGWGTGKAFGLGIAEHTYMCAGSSCYANPGGTTGGKTVLCTGTADQDKVKKVNSTYYCKISQYLVEGVCHQGANRLLYPTSNKAKVNKAKGYVLSYMLFGDYGIPTPANSAFTTAPFYLLKWNMCKKTVGM